MEEINKCSYGCNQDAHYKLKNGKWCCSSSSNSCSEVKKKNSEKVKQTYQNGRISAFTGHTTSWNKGLSKETDERLKQTGITLSLRLADGTIIPSMLGKHHSEETKKKLAKCGGFKKGIGRGKHGWYKGYWCDSSWELAWVIFNLEHEIKFERNWQAFNYEFEGKICHYHPDFKMPDGSYVEIKGYMDKRSEAKIQQFQGSLTILQKNEIKQYLEYAISKYGKDFIKLYENIGMCGEG